MTWIYTPFAGILWITAAISVVIAFLLSRRRTRIGVDSLILLMCAIAEWAFTSGLEAASVGLEQKIFWSKVEYLGAVTAPVLFFIFALNYAQKTRWLTRRNLILLFVLPLLVLIATATNELHHLIWTNFTPNPTEANTLIYGHGIGFYFLIGYDYLLLSAGFLVLVRTWFYSPHPYRRQVSILVVGSILPLVTGVLYSVDANLFAGLDVTPVSFLVTGSMLAFGMFMYQLFDLLPIARDTLIENMKDGILVVDGKDRIVDTNPVANKLFDLLPTGLLGQKAEAVLPFWPEIEKSFQNTRATRTEILLQQNPPRYLDLHISPLYDRYKRFTGRLLVFRDITEHRKTETDLAQNVEELKILNRINLAITAGLDLECLLKTLHEQCSQVAPIDVFYVALYDPASTLVNIPLYYDKGQYHPGITRDIHDQPGIIGNVIQARHTLYLQDSVKKITRPLIPFDSETKMPPKSYIGIPLTVREQIIGVMSAQSHRTNAYSEEQVRLLEQIAVQAAIAIENARLYAEEQRLAIIDELTNIYNYRGLIELGDREVERARRFSHPLSALFFDINNFHDFNNTYSHATGNIVLQNVVRRCCDVLRSVDVFARFGGDEFVALLPETDLANAELIARRLAEEIAATKINTPYGDLSVTISIGVTTLADNMYCLADLVDHANQAERRAKQSQKNVVALE